MIIITSGKIISYERDLLVQGRGPLPPEAMWRDYVTKIMDRAHIRPQAWLGRQSTFEFVKFDITSTSNYPHKWEGNSPHKLPNLMSHFTVPIFLGFLLPRSTRTSSGGQIQCLSLSERMCPSDLAVKSLVNLPVGT